MNKLEELRKLLAWKKGVKFYAEKLNITEEEVRELLKELRNPESIHFVYTEGTPFPKGVVTTTYPDATTSDLLFWSQKVNADKGTIESEAICDFEPKNDEELARLHKVDLSRYKISAYWTKQRGDKFTSSLLCTLIKTDSQENFQKEFKDFLSTFIVAPTKFEARYEQNQKKTKVSLILPRQDAHFNKLDINGDNDIELRFLDDAYTTANFIRKAKATNYLEEIVYIVGSDQFNSEWTGLTTKGTPQSNIYSYQEAFKLICNHEASMIEALRLECDNLKVVFIPGNHDEFVGWHLINWLEAYLKNSNVEFESSTDNTKYHKYGNSAIMLNHGDAIKPSALAAKFPIGFKEKWSQCENFYILTGDKHTEMTLDLNGIKFYRVPQLSTSTSKWDDKQGYTDSKSENTAFVITKDNGMSDVYKEIIN